MTKEKLRQYRRIKKESDWIRHRITALEAMAPSPTVKELIGPLQDKYNARLDGLVQDEIEILDALLDLNPRELEVVQAYYFDGMTWEQVARSTFQSISTVHRLHGAALRKMRGK